MTTNIELEYDSDTDPGPIDWMSIDSFTKEEWVNVDDAVSSMPLDESETVDALMDLESLEEGEIKEFRVGKHYEVLYNNHWYYCKIDKKVDSETYNILYKQYEPTTTTLACNNRLLDSMLNKVEFGVKLHTPRE